jgi:hypothetical protein
MREEKNESDIPPDGPKVVKARPASLLPDARGDAAQRAATDRWANWALKKGL